MTPRRAQATFKRCAMKLGAWQVASIDACSVFVLSGEPVRIAGSFCWLNRAPAASDHPGGVSTLFTDGSVKFMKESISVNIRMSPGTRNGSEVVSSDSY
jgi:prepilin-type processing-associated H-X9-DG protein